MLDLFQLLPHAKTDAKLDTKKDRSVINDVADAAGCSSAVFFEARKKADLYLWLSRPPDGPSAKFLVRNVHTMAELKLAGNHMRGSRPCLSFHGAFDDESKPHWGLLKTMLLRTFATPRRHPKSKPFFDHVLSFTLADNKIWIRNYQVVPGADRKGVLGGGSGGGGGSGSSNKADVETAAAGTGTKGGTKVRPAVAGMSLVEVGPRACLEPIKIFAGSFGGRVLYDNAEYVSPNTVREDREREREGGERRKEKEKEPRDDEKRLTTSFQPSTKKKKTKNEQKIQQVRSALKRQKAGKYGARVKAQQAKRKHAAANPTPRDELLDVFK